MSNGKPEVDDGYMKFAHELQEALCGYRIAGVQRQMFDVIVRLTYGFHKKEDKISEETFSKWTGTKQSNVHDALKQLEDNNLIKITRGKNKGDINSYSINKYYETWKGYIKRDISLYMKKDICKGIYKKDIEPICPGIYPLYAPAYIPYMPRHISPICPGICTKDTTKDTIKDTNKDKGKRLPKEPHGIQNQVTKEYYENRTTNQPDIPAYINKELWEQYLKVRKECGFKTTKTIIQGLLGQLERFHTKGLDCNDALTYSIGAGKPSLYEPNPKKLVTKSSSFTQSSPTPAKIDTDYVSQYYKGIPTKGQMERSAARKRVNGQA
jgi:phage replication O-like protein O